MSISGLQVAFRFNLVEDLLLERVGSEVKVCDWFIAGAAALPLQRGIETLTVAGLVVLEFGVVPICLERRRRLFPKVRLFVLADFDRPFEAVGQRCLREVR